MRRRFKRIIVPVIGIGAVLLIWGLPGGAV